MSNPEKSGQPGDFPPPPPGPPPYQQEQHQQQQQQPGLLSSQHQDFAAPAGNQSPQELPAYGLLPTQTEASVQPPPEKSAHGPGASNQQEFPHVAGASTAQQNFPPPPPGPPPADQHNLTSEKQHFPPPPPGGPPTHGEGQFPPSGPHSSGLPPTQEHPNPLYANPVNTEKAQHATADRPAERPNENYSIPTYDPAHPVFAPPPTNEVKPDHGVGTTPGAAHTAPGVSHTTAPGTTHTGVPPAAAASGAAVAVDSHKKAGWGERFSQFGLKAAAPINSIAHKLGSQSFLPETLDKECDKAAAILTAFCKKGTYADPNSTQLPTSTAADPKATETTEGIIDPTKEKPKNRVLVKIPTKVISRAVGLAIFTTLRAGFQVSGAIGSGILIARLPDGSWGPPSGIQVNTLGGGFLIGLDIYDCVCVINNKEALAAFTNTRVSLGGDLAVVAGPYGAGGAVDFGAGMEENDKTKDPKKESKDKKEEVPVDDSRLKPEKGDKKSNRRSLSASSFKPLFSYVKSRGFYAGLQIDGTVVVERKDANAAFYGERVSVEKILQGHVPQQGPPDMWPTGARNLIETLKSIDASAFKGKAPEGVPPSAPRSDPVTEHRSEEQPPAYVDDGTQRPGDVKYQYK